ncbi:hypothetical protein GCM10023149_03690 [Mucilaginibacter gynuensis]|uniref:Lipoprotein n=1 Tax=Mucilaginibacter gynuensis TaxID=1302236 RepID=A0ABP8FRR0_9SPHI
MKTKVSFILLALAFAACTSKQKNYNNDTAGADSGQTDVATKSSPGHICFLHTEGTRQQDTTFVHLIIDGDKITGQMNWIPSEKDSRKGTIEGTQDGNTIKAIWTYSQEGTKDTMAVEFDFPGDRLVQKPFTANKKTGRLQTDAKAAYSINFEKVNCKQ